MTFFDKYVLAEEWWSKVMIMEIYHLTMKQRDRKWTVANTAKYFGVSVGLVSENLKLASFIHTEPKLLKLSTRKDALEKLK
jgi:hypothetical protein